MDEQSKIIADLNDKLEQSEAKYKLLTEQATDGIYLIDLDETFIDVNAGLCNMLGYNTNELLQMRVHDIIDPEQLKYDPLFKSGLEYKRTIIRERRFIRKDRTVFEVEINVKMLNDRLVLVIARDITSRKKMEIELREAELKFRTLAENSMVGIYIIQDGKLRYVNPRFAAILGYHPNELIDTFPVEDLFEEEYKATALENVSKRMTGEVKSVHYEAKFLQKNGKLRWGEIHGSRADFDGKPSIIGSVIDITERKHAEHILTQSEANLQTMLNTSDTIYALFDSDLRVLALNQMALSFVKNRYQYEPKKGDYVFDFFPQDRFPRFASQAQGVLNGIDTSYEINLPTVDGAPLWYYVRLFPIKNGGEIMGMLITLYDITERKGAETKLQLAYDQIQNHLSYIKDIAWKQSHLMRSPIVNLKGLIEMLKNDPEDIVTLNYIKTEIGRLDDIIIDMSANKTGH